MKLIALPGKDSKNLDWGLRMTPRTRAVSVKQLPEKLDMKRGRLFFRELESCMNVERPCIVLDCSRLQEMDPHALHLLLCCLEGAIKRNGDVRLAALSPAARQAMESARIDRLFRIFDTVADAEESFQRRIAHTLPHPPRSCDEREQSVNAA
ncbi:STAS domain-containing protein [Acidobacteria bacterium AB60]|nr:STAS domain-containing protein [Acidobacteria bacterium AB60]